MPVRFGGRPLVIDANVLIDYLATDAEILSMTAHHLGQVLVADVILEEVNELSRRRAASLGLTVIEVSAELLIAAAPRWSRLSFADRVCVLLAGETGALCVTNERPMRNVCESEGIEVAWGLEIMHALLAARALDLRRALETGEAIHRSNPRFISAEVLARFCARARSIAESLEG